jgi:hypothetical protein
MPRICVMESVRELGEGFPVELWRDDDSGRLVVRPYNERHNGSVDIDFMDIISWCQRGPPEIGDLNGAFQQYGFSDGNAGH